MCKNHIPIPQYNSLHETFTPCGIDAIARLDSGFA